MVSWGGVTNEVPTFLGLLDTMGTQIQIDLPGSNYYVQQVRWRRCDCPPTYPTTFGVGIDKVRDDTTSLLDVKYDDMDSD